MHAAKMRLQNVDTSSITKLESDMRMIWIRDIDKDYCKHLVHSIPLGVRALIKNKGSMMKF